MKTYGYKLFKSPEELVEWLNMSYNTIKVEGLDAYMVSEPPAFKLKNGMGKLEPHTKIYYIFILYSTEGAGGNQHESI